MAHDPVAAMKSKFQLGQHTYLIADADEMTLVARKREFGIMVAPCKMHYLLGYCDGTTECPARRRDHPEVRPPAPRAADVSFLTIALSNINAGHWLDPSSIA
jgi:hypothetical protein